MSTSIHVQNATSVEVQGIKSFPRCVGRDWDFFTRDIVIHTNDGHRIVVQLYGDTAAAITIKGDEHAQLTKDLDTIGITKNGVTQRLPISFDGKTEPEDTDVLEIDKDMEFTRQTGGMDRNKTKGDTDENH